jgi:hypothetical protein
MAVAAIAVMTALAEEVLETAMRIAGWMEGKGPAETVVRAGERIEMHEEKPVKI